MAYCFMLWLLADNALLLSILSYVCMQERYTEGQGADGRNPDGVTAEGDASQDHNDDDDDLPPLSQINNRKVIYYSESEDSDDDD